MFSEAILLSSKVISTSSPASYLFSSAAALPAKSRSYSCAVIPFTTSASTGSSNLPINARIIAICSGVQVLALVLNRACSASVATYSCSGYAFQYAPNHPSNATVSCPTMASGTAALSCRYLFRSLRACKITKSIRPSC